MDPRAKNPKKDKELDKKKKEVGRKTQKRREVANLARGLAEYIALLDRTLTKFCFVKSLKASRRGCRIPVKETLLGPTRR